jgi:predicted solute-binding protein
MKITFSIWQGSLMKGHSFTASSMQDVTKTIEDLNSTGVKPKFEYFISKIEQETK